MSKPRQSSNINLPDNVYIRNRTRKSGKTVRYFTYRLHGKKEISLGTDYNHACLKAAQLNIERQVKSNKITFTDVAKRYRDEVISQKKTGTAKSNLVSLKPLQLFFHNAPLDEIKPSAVEQYMQWRRHTKGAANNEYSLFNHIWRYARKWGYTTLASPAQDVDKYPIKRRDHYVEDEIYQLVYRHASPDMQDLMDIAYLTGQRPVDVVNIQREHIFDGYLHIAQQKTQARLRFQMIGKLADILERRLKQEGNILFKTQNGTQLTVVNLRKQFFTLRNKIIEHYPEFTQELKSFQFRDLRAKSGTDKAISQGEEAARQQLGHTTVKMTKTYIRKAPIVTPLLSVPTDEKGE